MKALFTAVALAGTILGIASALAIDPRPGPYATPEQAEDYSLRHPGPASGRAAFAAAPRSALSSPRAASRSNDVYVNGRYAGSDPDATVRAKLAHDPSWAQ